MNLVDILVLVITIVIMGLIIYFSFIKPYRSGKNIQCASCPVAKQGKRLRKQYAKKYKDK